MITMAAMVMMLMAGVIRMLPGLAMMPVMFVMFVHAAVRSMLVRFACCGRRVRRRMVRVVHMRTHTPD